MIFPVVRMQFPSDLVGQRNGELDPRLLKPIPGGQLHHTAADAWNAMRAAAARDGIELGPSTSTNTYRPYASQLTFWTERYVTWVASSDGPYYFDGRFWWKLPGVDTAAIPGQSNHGWGLAIDVVGATNNRLAWLLANAWLFGFSWEIQSEPWHVRYVAGDAIPAAVLAWLAVSQLTPASHDDDTIDQGDEDMSLTVHQATDRNGDRHVWDIDYLPADGAQLNGLKVSCLVVVRQTPNVARSTIPQMFCGGEARPIELKGDGTSTFTGTWREGLLSIESDVPCSVTAREFWSRVV